jgi:hypothetical protein
MKMMASMQERTYIAHGNLESFSSKHIFKNTLFFFNRLVLQIISYDTSNKSNIKPYYYALHSASRSAWSPLGAKQHLAPTPTLEPQRGQLGQDLLRQQPLRLALVQHLKGRLLKSKSDGIQIITQERKRTTGTANFLPMEISRPRFGRKERL